MALSRRVVAAVASSGCLSCTFGGLGNYDVETCAKPTGTASTVQQVASITSTALTFVSGPSPIGAFPTQSANGSCAQAVGTTGYIESTCAFMLGLAPEQPWIVAMGSGYAAAAVATASQCTQGQLAFQFIGPSTGASAMTTCGAGVALPSIAPLATDGSSAIVTWYATGYPTRNDPIESCAGATAAPLLAALVSVTQGGTATLGNPVMLTGASTSVRPAAMAGVPGESAVAVAAPDANGVTMWTLDESLATGSQTNAVAIPALAGARAVALASTTDGSGRVAVVAEIGCAPQSIVLAVGTASGGFSAGTVVAAAADADAVQPTVAWVASENAWIVSWISTSGGAHALARRFDAAGNPLGSTIDPSVRASGATVVADGSLFAYVPSSNSFVSASLGCAE